MPIASLVVILSAIAVITIVGLLIWPFGVIKLGTARSGSTYSTPTVHATRMQTPRPTRGPTQTATAGSPEGVAPQGDPQIQTSQTMLSDIENSYVDSLEGLALEVYDDASYAGNRYSYTVYLTGATRVLWTYGWCTTTEQILDQNFQNITFEFTLNGRLIPASSVTAYQWLPSDRVCRLYGFELTDWPFGEHNLEIAVTFETVINDGWSDYPQGTFTNEYTVFAGE